MQIHLTAEQEADLTQIAEHEGKSPDALVTDIAVGLIEEREAFRIAVRLGLAEADNGAFVEEDEMERRLHALLMRA